MDYEFAYGSSSVKVSLPEDCDVTLLKGNSVPPVTDIRKTLIDSLESPTGSPALRQRLKKGDRVALVISDMSRFWMRQDLVIPHLTDYLTDVCGINDEDITIIVANGTHSPGDEKEMRTLVTDSVYERFRLKNHDCQAQDLVYIGTTSFGNGIYIDHDAAGADMVITLGAVTHHVMAGFGGGRKSILPGICGMDTIKRNHALSLDPHEFIPDPRTGNGILQGNPVHLDMCEAAGMIKNIFVISLVMNTDMILSGIYSGDLDSSWTEAVKAVDDMYTVWTDRPADVIFAGCGGYPKDMSMYQGTKTIDNIEGLLRPGGQLIFIAEARDGGGPEEYFGWMKDLTGGTFEHRLRNDFTIPGFIFFLNVRQAMKYDILMYTTIPPETLSPMGIKAFSDMDDLMKNVKLDDRTIYVIPCGSTVVPRVKGHGQ